MSFNYNISNCCIVLSIVSLILIIPTFCNSEPVKEQSVQRHIPSSLSPVAVSPINNINNYNSAGELTKNSKSPNNFSQSSIISKDKKNEVVESSRIKREGFGDVNGDSNNNNEDGAATSVIREGENLGILHGRNYYHHNNGEVDSLLPNSHVQHAGGDDSKLFVSPQFTSHSSLSNPIQLKLPTSYYAGLGLLGIGGLLHPPHLNSYYYYNHHHNNPASSSSSDEFNSNHNNNNINHLNGKRNGLTTPLIVQHNEILSKDELSLLSPLHYHHEAAAEQEEEQEEKLKRFYPNRLLPFPVPSWDRKQQQQQQRQGQGTKSFKQQQQKTNHANGLYSLLKSSSSSSPTPIKKSNENFKSSGSSSSLSLLLNESDQLNPNVRSPSSSSASSSSSYSSHEPLGTFASQWNLKLSHPLVLSSSTTTNTDDEYHENDDNDDDGRTQKRNTNYMCHFKLCQLGASGKRRWNPTQWFFNDPEYDYNSSKK